MIYLNYYLASCVIALLFFIVHDWYNGSDQSIGDIALLLLGSLIWPLVILITYGETIIIKGRKSK